MPLPDGQSIRSKGFTITGALAALEVQWGAEARNRVVAALDDETRALCTRAVLSSEWIPFRSQVALYRTAADVLGQGDLAVCHRIGRFTSEHEMGRVNRIFLQLAKLEHWVRMAGLLWRRYYTAGGLGVEAFGEESGTALVTGFNPIHPAFCHDFAGWLERTVELSGYRNAQARHATCLLDGAVACRYELSWKR